MRRQFRRIGTRVPLGTRRFRDVQKRCGTSSCSPLDMENIARNSPARLPDMEKAVQDGTGACSDVKIAATHLPRGVRQKLAGNSYRPRTLREKELVKSLQKLETKNSDFFGEYKTARMIIDLGTQHEKPKPGTPPKQLRKTDTACLAENRSRLRSGACLRIKRQEKSHPKKLAISDQRKTLKAASPVK